MIGAGVAEEAEKKRRNGEGVKCGSHGFRFSFVDARWRFSRGALVQVAVKGLSLPRASPWLLQHLWDPSGLVPLVSQLGWLADQSAHTAAPTCLSLG